MWNHSPHTTRHHIPKVLTLHHHRCDSHRPHNIEHSPSLALQTEVRSRNLSNTDQRGRPVDCDYIRTDGACCRLCMTPYSLEDTVRLFCCHCQGRRCLILVPPLRELQIFQICWGRFYETVQCPASTDGHLRHKKRLLFSIGSVLAFGTQVRGSAPGRSRRIFRAKKSSGRLPSEEK